KEKLNEALLESQKTGKFVGEILEEKGLISNDTILSLLIKQCKTPLVSLLSYSIDREILKIIPHEICDKYKILPIDKLGNTITLAMVNPMDIDAIEVAKQYCGNHQIRPILCSYKEFERVKTRYTPSQKQEDKTINQQPPPEKPITSTPLPILEEVKDETIPEAIIIDTDSLDPETEEQIQKENALLHTVFTEPISENTTLKFLESHKDDLSIHDLATSMISSLQGSYELLIRKIKLFHGLTTEEIANIFAYCKQIQLDAGEILFNKGDIGKSLYVLISGEIEIFDEEKHICFLSPGEMLGEMSVITKNKRSASARAVEESVLLDLDLNIIYRFIPSIVAIKLLTNIIFTLSERLTSITSKIQQPS
ncbi:MAG: cyclic nucleotide-binding domain-containing protein, partial [Candidatus Hydrogenedens sp.]